MPIDKIVITLDQDEFVPVITGKYPFVFLRRVPYDMLQGEKYVVDIATPIKGGGSGMIDGFFQTHDIIHLRSTDEIHLLFNEHWTDYHRGYNHLKYDISLRDQERIQRWKGAYALPVHYPYHSINMDGSIQPGLSDLSTYGIKSLPIRGMYAYVEELSSNGQRLTPGRIRRGPNCPYCMGSGQGRRDNDNDKDKLPIKCNVCDGRGRVTDKAKRYIKWLESEAKDQKDILKY